MEPGRVCESGRGPGQAHQPEREASTVARVEPSRARRRLAAIPSTDAVGFSRRMAEDDVVTVETLRSHRETIRGLVREHHGRVVDAVSDNLLAEFPSAVDSVACAIAAQQLLGERNSKLPKERRLPFRIGLHLGVVEIVN